MPEPSVRLERICADGWDCGGTPVIEFLSAGKDPAGVPDAIVALTHFGLRETRGGELVGEELLRLANEAPNLRCVCGAFHRLIQATIEPSPSPKRRNGQRICRHRFDIRSETGPAQRRAALL